MNNKIEISTKEKILDVALETIQKCGFSEMTLQNIAEQVGIKKPSILYHFPSKNAIGVAVVKRYHEYFKNAMKQAMADNTKTPWEVLDLYFTPFRQYSKQADRVCLCGVLASEYESLPEEIKNIVNEFFQWHHEWIETLLEHGQKEKVFSFLHSKKDLAAMFFSALQGGLLSARVSNNPGEIENIINAIQNTLKSDH